MVARMANPCWRKWLFCSGASNGARIARGRVALIARGDERSLLSRIAPPGVVAADGGVPIVLSTDLLANFAR